MSKIRSILLASAALALSQTAFAQNDFPSDLKVQIQMCLKGSECKGSNCAKIEATTSDSSRKFGITGFDAQNNAVLTCGAFLSSSYSFSVPMGMPVKFGVYFGGDVVVCDNGGITNADGNMKLAYTVTSNPNACSVVKVS